MWENSYGYFMKNDMYELAGCGESGIIYSMVKLIPESVAKKVRGAFLILLAMILTFVPSGLVYAALPSESELDNFNANGIYYYNPAGGDDCIPRTTGSNVAIIGDSVIEESRVEIKRLLGDAVIYAAPDKVIGGESDEAVAPTSSNNPSAVSIVKYWSAQGGMRDTLVIALGTDNEEEFTYDDVKVILDAAGTGIHIFFVLNFSTVIPDPFILNNGIFEKAAEYSNVNLIDWPKKVSEDAEKYISSDSTTPTGDGQKLLAQLIDLAVGGQSSAIGSVNGEYVNYAGRVMINDTQAQQIEENKPFYQRAIDAVPEAAPLGISWQLIAAIHLREMGLSRSNAPANVVTGLYEGIYGLHSYAETHPTAFINVGPVSDEEFLRQTTLLVNDILLPKAKSFDLTVEDGVKEFFLSYNGYSSQWNIKAEALGYGSDKPWEGSPYVMNFYDEPRDPKSPNMSPAWPGGYSRDYYYDPTYLSAQPGAYLIYELLGGGSGGFCGKGGLVSGGINNFEDVLALLKDYQYNVKCSDYIQPALCGIGGLQNCVAFSVYFITRFTSYRVPTAAPGNGIEIVSSMVGETLQTKFGSFSPSYDMSEGGFTYGGTEPRPYSVFSTRMGSNSDAGHTGVVVGVDVANNKAYLAQAGYGTSFEYYQSREQIEWDLDRLTNGDYWFAYMDSLMNYNEVGNAIEAGRKHI